MAPGSFLAVPLPVPPRACRLRCDNLKTTVLVQDSIGGEVEENQCSVKRRGCVKNVSAKIRAWFSGGMNEVQLDGGASRSVPSKPAVKPAVKLC